MNKILRYLDYKDVTTASVHTFVIRYYFSLIEELKIDTPEEENETENIFIDVEISELKAASWNLVDESAYPSLIKILFEYGKRELIKKIKDSTVEEENLLRIYSNTHPEENCPFNPNKIIMKNYYELSASNIKLKEESVFSGSNLLQSLFTIKYNVIPLSGYITDVSLRITSEQWFERVALTRFLLGQTEESFKEGLKKDHFTYGI